jgi:hypothetical protein
VVARTVPNSAVDQLFFSAVLPLIDLYVLRSEASPARPAPAVTMLHAALVLVPAAGSTELVTENREPVFQAPAA